MPCCKPDEDELERLRIKREKQAEYRAAAEATIERIKNEPNHDWKLSNPHMGIWDLRDWNDEFHVWKNLSGDYPPPHPDPDSIFNQNMDVYTIEDYDKLMDERWKTFSEEELQTEFKRWAARKEIEIREGRGYPHEADGFYDTR